MATRLVRINVKAREDSALGRFRRGDFGRATRSVQTAPGSGEDRFDEDRLFAQA
ncbi:hypothetical protein ACIRO3_30625 [Streptomyces sp. NPDC102278]|uniref:hypothetical protein n=1 Tax=Streptomyces sp. NPDC102278 TaxID=3366152 RepID=UPI0038195D14